MNKRIVKNDLSVIFDDVMPMLPVNGSRRLWLGVNIGRRQRNPTALRRRRAVLVLMRGRLRPAAFRAVSFGEAKRLRNWVKLNMPILSGRPERAISATPPCVANCVRSRRMIFSLTPNWRATRAAVAPASSWPLTSACCLFESFNL